MIGALLTDIEVQEVQYLLKREMEELLLDLEDERIEGLVKRSMEERYHIIFGLFSRFATPSECGRFVRSPSRKNQV